MKALLAIAVILAFQNFVYSCIDLAHYHGHDLWEVIRGARLFIAGADPYLASSYPGGLVTTHTPFVLLLVSPFCMIPYSIQRYIWWVFEWSALVASIYLLWKSAETKRDATVFLVLALVFFVGGRFWRCHLELGQRYVYLLLLASLSWFWHESNPIKSRVCLGAICAWRPTYLLMLPVFWWMGHKQTALDVAGWVVLCVLLTLPVGGFRAWKGYFRLMSQYAQESVNPNISAPSMPLLFDGVNVQPYLEGRQFETLNVTFWHFKQFRFIQWIAARI